MDKDTPSSHTDRPKATPRAQGPNATTAPPPHHPPPTTGAAPHAHADAWKPALDRRQSWSKEDQKHALQMSGMAGAGSAPGFTEKPGA